MLGSPAVAPKLNNSFRGSRAICVNERFQQNGNLRWWTLDESSKPWNPSNISNCFWIKHVFEKYWVFLNNWWWVVESWYCGTIKSLRFPRNIAAPPQEIIGPIHPGDNREHFVQQKLINHWANQYKIWKRCAPKMIAIRPAIFWKCLFQGRNLGNICWNLGIWYWWPP